MPFKNKYLIPLEFLMGVLGITLLIYFLRTLLVTGETTFVHDNFQWFLPVFHYYARNISQGHLPLWNPFTHGGEPFYPLLMQLRLLEPISILTVLVGKFFTSDSVLLFNWNRFILGIWMVLGVYRVLRRFTKDLWIRSCLIPILLFSSIFLGSFHQDGILSQFLWVPWICLYLLKIFQDKDTSWQNFCFLAICIGINFQSYQFVGPTLYTLFFIIFVCLYKRPLWNELRSSPQFYFKLSGGLIIILAMAAPNLVLLFESKNFLYSLRLLPENYQELLLKNTGLLPQELTQNYLEVGLNMPYDLIPYTGAFIKIWEYIQLLTPAANPNIHAYSGHSTFGSPSEAYMYLGVLPWLIALWGMCFGRDEWKKVFGALTLCFGLLMMGPPGGLHRILFPILPPLWFIRHTDLFVLFFVFGILYFFVLGLNHLKNTEYRFKLARISLLYTLLSAVLVYSLVMAMTTLNYPVFKYPLTAYLFVGFLVIGGCFYVFRSQLGSLGIWLSLIAAHISIVCSFQNSLHELLPLFFIIPFSLFFFKPRNKFNYLVISTTIVLDLLLAFHQARFLYSAQTHPRLNLGLELDTSQTSWNLRRKLSVNYPQEYFGRPVPRYLSLLMNETTAFSPLIRFKGESVTLQNYSPRKFITQPRWNHFLMSRDYEKFINQDLNEENLLQLLAINQLPFLYSPRKFDDNHSLHPIILNALAPQDMSIEKQEYNSVNLTVNFNAPGSLFWSDGYDRYWYAFVNDIPTPVFKAHTLFKAISLAPGKHQVRWYYDPYPFKWALVSFYCIPLLSILLLWLSQFESLVHHLQKLKPFRIKRSFKFSKH